jgi:hypothetical protein
MRSIRIINTSKLFWKKFPYKAVLYADWTVCIRRYSLDDLISEAYPSVKRVFQRNESKVKKLLALISSVDEKEIKIRSEHYSLSIYFKDRSFVDALQKDFFKEFVELHEPKDPATLDYLLNNFKTEIKPELPHGCRYKVILSYDTKSPQQHRDNFIEMSKRNSDYFYVTPIVASLIKVDRPWYSQRYIFVKDDHHLLMTQMMLQHNIRSIVEIKTQDEIKESEINE